MSIFLVLAALLVSVHGNGVVDDLFECVAGSETGDKIGAAFEACANSDDFYDYDNDYPTTRNDDDMCYDFNSTMNWLAERFSFDLCFLREMGWINENETDYNWDQWIADINGLPEDVSGALMAGQDEWQLCWQDKVEEWGKDDCYNGPTSLYSDEEKEVLAHIGGMVAQYDCFKDGMMEACSGNDEDVLHQCVADSNTGDKLEDAFESCFAGTHDHGSERSIMKKMSPTLGSRNDNETHQCYGYNETMDWINEYYADDMCVLDHMGWFLSNGTIGWNMTIFINDINGLPADTAEGIWSKQEEWEGCVSYLTEQGAQDPCWNGTESLYSGEEKQELAEIGAMLAEHECFKHFFHETCMELYEEHEDNSYDDQDDYYHDDEYYGTHDDYYEDNDKDVYPSY